MQWGGKSSAFGARKAGSSPCFATNQLGDPGEKILDLSTASSVKLRDGTHLTVLLWGLNNTTNVTILDSGSMNVNYLFHPPPLQKNIVQILLATSNREKSQSILAWK